MDYERPVQFGCFLIPDATIPHRALELAILADELGFDLIGVQDHPYQRRFYDTWTLLTAIDELAVLRWNMDSTPSSSAKRICSRSRRISRPGFAS